MNRDQLRALADALDDCRPYQDSVSVYQAAEFLRRCADQQPVAWRFKVRVWLGEDHFEEQWRVSTACREGAEPLYTEGREMTDNDKCPPEMSEMSADTQELLAALYRAVSALESVSYGDPSISSALLTARTAIALVTGKQP